MLCIRTRKDKTGNNKVHPLGNDNVQMGHVEHDNDGTNVPDAGQDNILLIARKLDVILQKMKENDKDDEIKYEWRIAALTIDRFFLICSTLALIFITISCFAPAPGYVT